MGHAALGYLGPNTNPTGHGQSAEGFSVGRAVFCSGKTGGRMGHGEFESLAAAQFHHTYALV